MTSVIERIEVDFQFSDLPLDRMSKAVRNRMRPQISFGLKIVIWLAFVLVGIGLMRFLERQGTRGSEVAEFLVVAVFGAALMFFALVLISAPVNKRIIRSMKEARMRRNGTRIVLDAAGIATQGTGSHGFADWQNIQDVITIEDTTLLLYSGAEFYPIPHANLPAGISPSDLAAQIAAWRGQNQ